MAYSLNINTLEDCAKEFFNLRNSLVELMRDITGEYIDPDIPGKDIFFQAIKLLNSNHLLVDFKGKKKELTRNVKKFKVLLEYFDCNRERLDEEMAARNPDFYPTYEKENEQMKINEQLEKAWRLYTESNELEEYDDIAFLAYIPEDVELNAGMDLYEDVEPEVKGIKMVELKETPIGEEFEYVSSKIVPSSDTVSLEQDIKRTARQRTSHENKASDRYGQ